MPTSSNKNRGLALLACGAGLLASCAATGFAEGRWNAIASVLTGALGAMALLQGIELIQTPARRTGAPRPLTAGADTLQTILSTMQGGLVIVDQQTRTILEANPAACDLLGRPHAQIVGSACHCLGCPGAEGACPISDQAQRLDNVPQVLVHASGRRIPVLKSVNRAVLDGRPCLVESFIDISRHQQAEEQLRMLSRAVEQTPASVVITDRNGNIEYVNAAFVQVSGYSAQEVVGRNPRVLKSGLTPPAVYRQMWQTLASGREWRGELQNRRKNGEFHWELAVISPITDTDGQTTHYVAVKEDITERKRIEQELRTASQVDRLTGLPNRALLCDRLAMTIERSRRVLEYGFAVLFLDFDRFKIINDSLGHDAGDELLREISRRLRQSVRSVDSVSRDAEATTAARLGGDEFVLLLDHIAGRDDAVAVAERILTALAQPYNIMGREIYSTASIGIVTSDMAAGSPEEILRDADTAMYEAKVAGKGRYVLFDGSMRDRAQQRLVMESDLRSAIDQGHMFLLYQPIVSLETGRIESFEALLRWQHPERGEISPAEFVPVAEECGLILSIGEWALREACRQYTAWRAARPEHAPPGISVNLSRAQLMLPNLVHIVEGILKETGVEPSRLHLEITETAVMSDPGAAIRTLRELKALGVRLNLDDFGTGYSSLSCLHLLPLDIIKIDRSFIANVSRGGAFTALVLAVGQLARNLGIAVVAEGIETVEHLQMLQALDCQCGQGFLFACPMTPHEALEYHVDLPALRARAAA